MSVNRILVYKMKLKKYFFTFGALLFLPIGISCLIKNSNMDTTASDDDLTDNALIRYVALGDSYTIGEGAIEPDEAWPTLLTNNLIKSGYQIKLIANPSKTGWTTQD